MNPSTATVTDDGIVSAQTAGLTIVVAAAGEARDSAVVRVLPGGVQPTVAFDDISAGAAHTCAHTPEGRAYCWGGDWHGELGDGNAVKLKGTLSPMPVTGALIFSVVGVGSEHTCAVASDQRTYCWGDNLYGQLGEGTMVARASPAPIQSDSGLVFVSAGGAAACGLTSSGVALCWGKIGNTQSSVPSIVQTTTRYATISAGGMHACGLSEDGFLDCWGRNDYGQLGDGTTDTRVTPTRILGGDSYLSVSAGYIHTCAVSKAGVVSCWGNNFGGRLGTGSEAYSSSPKPVELPAAARYVSAGGSHSCALTIESRIYCWGNNSRGQLGNDLPFAAPGLDPAAYRSFTPVLAVAPDVEFSAVDAGSGDHTCALTVSGVAYCWGSNDVGQLGVGRRERVTPDGAAVRTVPTRVVDPFLP
jgi:alpha-tubulin suppressor-like RCC1 family protein